MLGLVLRLHRRRIGKLVALGNRQPVLQYRKLHIIVPNPVPPRYPTWRLDVVAAADPRFSTMVSNLRGGQRPAYRQHPDMPLASLR